MRFLERIADGMESVFTWIAGTAIVVMMLVTVANMVLRKLGTPFGAVAEVVGWCAALGVAFALGYSQAWRAHIAIELLVDRFPRKIQSLVGVVVMALSVAMFALATYQVFLYGHQLLEGGQLAESLRIPYFPVVWAVGVGMGSFVLRLFIDLARNVRDLVAT